MAAHACLKNEFKAHLSFSEQSEFVTVQDLNSDHDRRNLDAGLPRYLEFNLLRDGAKVNLKLEENVHLSKYPPVYDAEKRADGKFRWIQKDMPHLQVFYYSPVADQVGVAVLICYPNPRPNSNYLRSSKKQGNTFSI